MRERKEYGANDLFRKKIKKSKNKKFQKRKKKENSDFKKSKTKNKKKILSLVKSCLVKSVVLIIVFMMLLNYVRIKKNTFACHVRACA